MRINFVIRSMASRKPDVHGLIAYEHHSNKAVIIATHIENSAVIAYDINRPKIVFQFIKVFNLSSAQGFYQSLKPNFGIRVPADAFLNKISFYDFQLIFLVWLRQSYKYCNTLNNS